MEAEDAVQAASQRGFKLHLTKDSSSPLVVLLGWFGAKDKTLAKYGSLVNSLGYSHMRAILPTEHVLWPFDGGRTRFARLVLDFLLEAGLTANRPVIIYCFSNGGTFAYEEMYKLMFKDPGYQQVQRSVTGLIFDSAPSYMQLRRLHRASMLVMRPSFPAWAGPLIFLVIWILAVALSLVSLAVDGFAPPRPVQYWRFLEGAKLGVPELYLFSKEDELTDRSRLLQLVATRQAGGVDATAEEFVGSPHCGHLKLHPAQYSTCVSSFLQRVSASKGRSHSVLNQ